MTQLVTFETAGAFSRIWAEVALEATVKATLLLTAAFAASWMLRRSSAALRHLVWVVTLIGLIALPFLSAGLPSWEAAVFPAAVSFSYEDSVPTETPRIPTRDMDVAGIAASGVSSPAAGEARETSVRGALMQADPVDDAAGFAARPLVSPADRPGSAMQAGPEPVVWAFALWAAGFLAVLFRYVLGVVKVREIVKHGQAAEDSVIETCFRRCQATLGLDPPARLLLSSRARVPLAWGWRRPVIVLPAQYAGWPFERRRTVLLHEVAHLRRGDVVSQFPARLACALFWFHPLVWTAVSRFRFEAELACDDVVLAVGAKASDYACVLVEAAKGIRWQDALCLAAPTMATPSLLEDRIQAILDTKRNRRSPSPLRRLGLSLAAACLIVPLALVKPTATAQTSSPQEAAEPAQDPSGADSLPRPAEPEPSGFSLLPENLQTNEPAAAPLPAIPTPAISMRINPATPLPLPVLAPAPAVRQAQLQGVLLGQASPELGSYGSYALLAQSAPRPQPDPEKAPSPETIRAGVAALASALKSADPEVRKHAAEALGQMGEAALPAAGDLTAALEDADAQVQKEALEALAQVLRRADAAESGQAVAAFGRILQSTDPAMRKDAAEALGRMTGAAGQALPLLIRALEDPDPQVQKEAAEGIGRLVRHVEGSDLSNAITALSDVLPKAAPEVRRQIVESLGGVRNRADEVAPVLIKAVDDPDPAVQKEAVEALGRILRRGNRSARLGDVHVDVAEIYAEIEHGVDPAEIQRSLQEVAKRMRAAQKQLQQLKPPGPPPPPVAPPPPQRLNPPAAPSPQEQLAPPRPPSPPDR